VPLRLLDGFSGFLQSYSAEDVPAEINEPVILPLSNHSLAILQKLKVGIQYNALFR